MGAIGAVLGAIALPATALAQTVDGDSADATGRDTITVTAQRREESLQDVPVAISAFGAEDLENRQIRDVLDLQGKIPNAFISNGTGTANSARIFFRGVGEDESRGAIDPAVGIYVDGVYLGRTVGSLLDVVDVERIEVLRGPQGTLYGRNTNGGAIKLISQRPQSENSLDIGAGFGSDSRLQFRGVGNLAFSDQTAARVAVLYKERDGFHELIPNGDLVGDAREVGQEEVFSIRGSIRHDFTETWSAMVAVDYTKDNSDPTPSSIIAESDDPSVVTDADGNLFTVEPQPGVTCSSFTPGIFQPVGCFSDFGSDIEIFGVSLNINGQIGTFDVASITSYRTMEDNLSSHIGFPFFQNTDQDQFSQEVTLSSNFEGPFNFLSGVYFYTEDAVLDTTFISDFLVDVETQSFAVFTQGDLDITDSLTLTAGVRYTTEERDFFGENESNAASATPFSPNSRTETIDSDNVNFTVKMNYAFTDDVSVYASFANGFKTPGFSPDCFGPTACFLPVEEEQLDSFEVGLRSEFFDNRVRFNATYFYNDYQDLQISATVPGLGFTRINADQAKIQGVEIEANFYPTENLELFTNLGFLDAEYDSLTEQQAAGITNDGAACPGGVPSVECALGLELKNAPEFKVNVGFLATAEALRGEFTLGGDLAYEDESFALIANNPGSLVDPGVTFNARLAYRPDRGPWSIAVWGQNLGDREYFRAATAPNQVFAMPPRTWGVDLNVSF